MTSREYIEAVLEVAHARTLSGRLQWVVKSDSARAELTASVSMRFRVRVTGPDTASWESLAIYDTDLDYATDFTNKDAPLANYTNVPTGVALAQIEDLFERVYLAPKRSALLDSLAKVRGKR